MMLLGWKQQVLGASDSFLGRGISFFYSLKHCRLMEVDHGWEKNAHLKDGGFLRGL